MNLAQRLLRFFFPPSRWQGCQQPRNAERLAEYERKLGDYRAECRLRDERVQQVFDARASVRPKITPRLPDASNVIPIRRVK